MQCSDGYYYYIYKITNIINGKFKTFNNRTGTCWISNIDLQESKVIFKNELEYFMNSGWILGRKYNSAYKAWINNDIEHKQIPKEELETYLSSGWKRGKLKYGSEVIK